MEKSIETIWREGFLKNDALVAPKVNNLFDQKSIHIIDKFRAMLKSNLKYVVIGSFAFLFISFLIRIPIAGIGFFVILNAIAFINKKIADQLNQIDKGDSSYQYLKSFESWMKSQLSLNRKMARCYYPAFFLLMVTGFWFSGIDDIQLGQLLMDWILSEFPETHLLFGLPVIGLIIVLVIASVLAVFGGQIYNWDVNIIYGRVFNKLEEILKDMEDLQREN